MTTIMQTNDVKTSAVVKTTHVDNNQPKATDILNAAVSANPLMINVDKKKKKRSPFAILKAAMLMLRQRPSAKQAKKLSLDKQKSIAAAPNADWKKLVGSMRPLHLQESPESPESPKKTPLPIESVEEIIPRPGSPTPSSSGTMSQYASASSLRDLDDSSDSEEDDPDEVFDAITGDEMIDSKAEEFIAQFYKQIQIQNNNTSN